MAAPLFSAIVDEAGKTILRKAGRFISKKAFELQSGRSTQVSTLAQRMHAEIGPPMGGGDWVSRTRQSAEKFTEFLADSNELG